MRQQLGIAGGHVRMCHAVQLSQQTIHGHLYQLLSRRPMARWCFANPAGIRIALEPIIARFDCGVALKPKQFLHLLKDSYRRWDEVNAPTLGAAISYYTAF